MDPRVAQQRKKARLANKFEARRQELLKSVNDDVVSPDGVLPMSGTKPLASKGGGSSPHADLEFMQQTKGALDRLKNALSDAAGKATTKAKKAVDPMKPSLTDVARVFLQDRGETISGRQLYPSELQFISEAHQASTYVESVREMFREVDQSIHRRIEAIDERRKQLAEANPNGQELTEHITYTEYLKYMRKKGYLKDEREEVPEGNLIPILAVLQGQAESVGFLKSKRKLVRIGDFVVEVDPNDPLFQRYGDPAEDALDEEKIRQKKLFRNGKFAEVETQTDARDDDATDSEIAYVYRKLDECQSTIEALNKAKLEAELFCETALVRIVNLRHTTTKMYDTLESGQATLMRLTSEAMSQNERLWQKLELIAQGNADEKAKRSINRTFTQQIEQLQRLVTSLKVRMEEAERTQMQLVDDGHYQETVHEKKMDDLRKQVIPRAVKEELSLLLMIADGQALPAQGGGNQGRGKGKASVPTVDIGPGGHFGSELKGKLEVKIDMLYESCKSGAAKESFDFVLPAELRSMLQSAPESAFASMDEIVRHTCRHVFDMMMNPHNPALVVQCVTEVRDLLDEVRRATQHIVSDFALSFLDIVFKQAKDFSATLAKVTHQMEEQRETHANEMKRQSEELTRQFSQKLSGSVPMEQFEREKQKAVTREKEKFLNQIGREIPVPVMDVPKFSSPLVIGKPLLQPTAHPQDIIHFISNYLTDVVLETTQLCTKLNQPVPSRLQAVAPVLSLLKSLHDQVTTNEGLLDGVASADPDLLRSVLPDAAGVPPAANKLSPSEAQRLTEQWWATAGGSSALVVPSRNTPNPTSPTPVDDTMKRAFEAAAALLNSAPQFTQAHLQLRSKLAELHKAPEAALTATLALAKEKATELRAAGTIKEKKVDATELLGNDASLRKKKKGGKRTGGVNGGGGGLDDDGEDKSLAPPLIEVPVAPKAAVPTVDRATSPMAREKKSAAGPKSSSPPPQEKNVSRALLEERAAVKAKQELTDKIFQSYQPLHAAVEFLRIAIVDGLLGEEATTSAVPWHLKPADNTFASSAAAVDVLMGEDRDLLDRLCNVILHSASMEPLEAARARYRLVAPKLKAQSRVRMFLTKGEDKGVMCGIIGGREAILTSPEAIDYAIHNDVRIFSNRKREMRIRDAVSTSPPPPVVVDSASGGGDDTNPPGGLLPPIFSSPIPFRDDSPVRAIERDIDPIAVRRLVRSTPLTRLQQYNMSSKQHRMHRGDATEREVDAAAFAAYQRGRQFD